MPAQGVPNDQSFAGVIETLSPQRRPAWLNRSGSMRMIASLCASLMPPQRAISSSVRPQPEHRPLLASNVQTLMQGDEIMERRVAVAIEL